MESGNNHTAMRLPALNLPDEVVSDGSTKEGYRFWNPCDRKEFD